MIFCFCFVFVFVVLFFVLLLFCLLFCFIIILFCFCYYFVLFLLLFCFVIFTGEEVRGAECSNTHQQRVLNNIIIIMSLHLLVVPTKFPPCCTCMYTCTSGYHSPKHLRICCRYVVEFTNTRIFNNLYPFSGIDYMLQARLADGRAKEAEQKLQG